jgi:RNA polymerase sigma-70 factor (ECF subfamily)
MADDPRGSGPARQELERELESLHEASWGWALGCCGRHAADASDVLQTAYLKVLDGRARFDGRSSFRTWLFGVIRRTAAEARRRERLRRWRLVTLGDAETVADAAAGPAARVERSEEAGRVAAALTRLARRQREVLELVFYHDMSIREAAQVMGVSLGSARRHYERGKQRLRAILQREGP